MKVNRFTAKVTFAINIHAPSEAWVQKYLEEMSYDFGDVDRDMIPIHTKVDEYEMRDIEIRDDKESYEVAEDTIDMYVEGFGLTREDYNKEPDDD